MILEIIWSLLSFGGLVRALTLWREAVLDRRSLGTNANGRRLLANWQVEHAWQGVLIYLLLFSAGASAFFYRVGIMPLHFRLLVAACCLTLTLIVLVIRQERDASYRRRTIERAVLHERKMAEDTNVRVREMQSRGQHDQAEEEADRKEGRKHRGVP